jgi:Lrp/AsnC family transcriptional regulator for asnA, asnC and gidA
MVAGYSNRAISNKIKKPLSTVQRRTRQLLERGLIKHTYKINYKKLGYKVGLLHIYLSDGNAQELAEKIHFIKDVLSVSIHLGNSDVVAEYACQDTMSLIELMAEVKGLPGVRNVVWSEEVSAIATDNNLQSSASVVVSG